MPAGVPLVKLPAQQVPDPASGHLHDRRRRRDASVQSVLPRSH
jgi:hypothetical protein